jgi:hypothetical protein
MIVTILLAVGGALGSSEGLTAGAHMVDNARVAARADCI